MRWDRGWENFLLPLLLGPWGMQGSRAQPGNALAPMYIYRVAWAVALPRRPPGRAGLQNRRHHNVDVAVGLSL